MKKLMLIFILTVFYACSNNPHQPVVTPPKDTVVTPKNCPLPLQLTDPNANPIGIQYASKLSPDGTKLFFSLDLVGINILDLSTLKVTQFDIRPLLPKNTKLGGLIPVIFWCPYDNTKFVYEAQLGVDTVGDGKKYPGGEHLIISSIDGSYYEDITPKVFGPLGSFFGLAIDAWLPSSTKGNDWFLIGYRLKERGKHYYGCYNPATQEQQEQEYKGLSAYTNDWKNKYYVNYDSSYKLRYYINDNELVFKDIEYASTSYASFSPDGMLFAIAADVYDRTKPKDTTGRLAEVWIVDVEKFMQNPVQPVPVKIINIKDKLCMFSYGLHPVFTSNNTIAVSMFHAGDSYEFLYEIDLDANLIRQLTFSP